MGLIAASAAAACRSGGGTKGPSIAVIPKGTTHEFWKSVHAGAVKASRELAVPIVWKGPLKEDDLKSQVDLVQSFVAQGVSGIVLAPLNDKALVAPVKAAVSAGIPVVVFDSDLAGDAHVSFVATDNKAAGKKGGEHLAKLMGGAGKVVVLRYQEGSASTKNREEGALDALRGAKGVEVVSDNRYGGATTESAFAESERLLTANKAAEGGVSGVFCPNESTTFGMLLALQKLGLAGKIKFVGFDSSDKLVAALSQGHLHGLLLQDPMNMGYLAVSAMIKHLEKKPIERRVDTGAHLATKENMGEPAIKALLTPDLKPWLGE